ncbi:MAG: hypothetical protein L0Z07_08770 [Planctomycetes bacterium]|nr:hypothetical protein [Planctomycetota bacterium]
MWCSNCQQDVPAVGHAVYGHFVCSQCQQPMGSNKPAYGAKISDDGLALDEPMVLAAGAPKTSPPSSDNYSARERLRRVGRGLGRVRATTPSQLNSLSRGTRRLDPAQISFDDMRLATSPDLQAIAAQLPSATEAMPRRREGRQVVAWLFVVTGAMVLAGGLGLVGWSLSAKRADIWNLALGLTLGGQGILIFGLTLVVSRLWRNSRHATGKLQNVHAQLVQLQRSADAITAMRGGAPAFYADLARGASPHVLLANLKGQVDQLAARFGGNR